MNNKVIVSVSNDLSTDRRVDNTCQTLTEMGFDVLLVGRRLKNSREVKRNYKTRRLKLLFNKGFLFYAVLNIRLFYYLFHKKAQLLIANDLDTLPANYLVSKFKKIPLVYDTHEFFTGVPELVNRHRVRKIWERIEKRIFPKLKYIITVNKSIADLYNELYNKEIIVVRNIPPYREIQGKLTRQQLSLPDDKKIILLQGAWINVNRGGEEAVEAMKYVENALLLIIGGGDVIDVLKKMTEDMKLTDKILFIPKLPFDSLFEYTIKADIGLTIDKDTNINYRFSLPNKLFDYINAGVPVLASPLVEVKSIVGTYKVGELIENHDPQHIAGCINKMLENNEMLKAYRQNCIIAKKDLCWEKEKIRLADFLSDIQFAG